MAIVRLALVRGKAMQHNLHSSHKRHFVHELVGQWQVWLGKAADVIIYRMGHPIHLFIEILFWGHPLVSIYTGHIYLHVFAYSEVFTYLFPTFSSHQFSNHLPSKSLPIQPNYWSQPITWNIFVHLAISLSKQINNQVHCLKFCPLGGFPFTIVLHGCPRKVQ